MKAVGLDYWQVCSHYPEYFIQLVEMHRRLGIGVCIISAVGKDRAGTVAAAVAKLGFTNIDVHEVVFEHPRQSPELKLAKCLELGIGAFYDDRDDVCRLLNQHGIIAMRVTRRDNSTYDLGAEQK